MIRVLSLSLLLLAGCGGETPSGKAPEAPVADNAEVQNRGANKDNWWDALPRAEWSAFEAVPQAQDWFEVYRVSDGVFAIYEPGQFEEVISFLVVGEERALLFDSGLGIGDMRAVVDELTPLDVVVVNSHSHYDHIGGNHQFDTVYSTGTDYSIERAKGSTPEDVAGFFTEGWVWKPLPAGVNKASFRSEPYTISKTIADGEVIDLGGRKLEVVRVPGHAPDALCLLDRENRIIFTGDTFYKAPLYTHLEGSDFDEYAKSAEKLAAMANAYDYAYTAHNVPVVSGDYLVAMAAAFRAIQSGELTEYTVSDGNREYFFDGFSIIVKGEKPD
jgi:glyoxylase-like metal-dependent hydrolase (beta-lactamase superfamily II)